ncbi:hypothetical protein MJM99_33130, partial [Salmonella enterica subsp. enterica serovar Kentucky]|nr:hypothetical protein [Salmonella enterica subsp. enterica serovar Kentucky]
MKKFTVAALALTTLLSGSAFAHEAGEFFMRAGPATIQYQTNALTMFLICMRGWHWNQLKEIARYTLITCCRLSVPVM